MDELIESYQKTLPKCFELEKAQKFNNFVKAYLIKSYLRPCGNVLDMPCGKGGDLKKYKCNNAGFYCGIDIVADRIQEAESRYKKIKCMFAAVFMVGDFTEKLELRHQYDLISCQFAFHYAWDTRDRALCVLRNAFERLCDDGHVIMSYPDWNVIVDRLIALKNKQDKNNFVAENVIQIGSENFHLKFETSGTLDMLIDDLRIHCFNQKYVYYQKGAVDNIAEYMVHPTALKEMCSEVGFQVVLERNFEDFSGSNLKWNELKQSMGVPETLDSQSLELIGLYKVLVLAKARKRPRY